MASESLEPPAEDQNTSRPPSRLEGFDNHELTAPRRAPTQPQATYNANLQALQTVAPQPRGNNLTLPSVTFRRPDPSPEITYCDFCLSFCGVESPYERWLKRQQTGEPSLSITIRQPGV